MISTADLEQPFCESRSLDESLRMYNPAIVQFRGRLLMAWRMDSGRRLSMRRHMGVCALDDRLSVIQESKVNLSTTIQGGGVHHYDPRFLVWHDRLFIHYNNNFLTRPNLLFLVELDPDTLEAKAAARPILLDAPRQMIEKNWMFFEHEDELLAVYQIAPHVILDVNLSGNGPIVCTPRPARKWDISAYATRFGTPCGGSPPVRCGNEYISFFHSRIPVSRMKWVMRYWPIPMKAQLPRYVAAIERRLRQPFDQWRYYAGAYAFSAQPPFDPLWITAEPVLRPEDEPPRTHKRRINPSADGIVYPCGAIAAEGCGWLVSYGLHDESCCLRHVESTSFKIHHDNFARS